RALARVPLALPVHVRWVPLALPVHETLALLAGQEAGLRRNAIEEENTRATAPLALPEQVRWGALALPVHETLAVLVGQEAGLRRNAIERREYARGAGETLRKGNGENEEDETRRMLRRGERGRYGGDEHRALIHFVGRHWLCQCMESSL